MSKKAIALKIQTARDTMGECLSELRDALEEVEELEDSGADAPLASGDIERGVVQAHALFKRIDGWASLF